MIEYLESQLDKSGEKVEKKKVKEIKEKKEISPQLQKAIDDFNLVTDCQREFARKKGKAKQWVDAHLKDGVGYPKIEIMTMLYNRYGMSKNLKENEKRADEQWDYLIFENLIKWDWENHESNTWIKS